MHAYHLWPISGWPAGQRAAAAGMLLERPGSCCSRARAQPATAPASTISSHAPWKSSAGRAAKRLARCSSARELASSLAQLRAALHVASSEPPHLHLQYSLCFPFPLASKCFRWPVLLPAMAPSCWRQPPPLGALPGGERLPLVLPAQLPPRICRFSRWMLLVIIICS